ncbi:MAG: FtsW/RodA/SpoVE family cell cycle protein [Arcobacteraceae bacterium]|jgi:rod shape determining protein RodA|nr:FtsW/RodA/SpoVE family cell cycle protein [Arcobacteraceae bacterium]
MNLLDKRIISHFNYELILFIFPLIILSHTLVGEISDMLAQKQLIYYFIAFMLFVVVLLLPIRDVIDIIPFFYWIGVLLLFAVLVVGTSKLGASRWLFIPIINQTVQPSELIKPFFLLQMAFLIHKKPPPKNGYGWGDFSYFSIFILLPFFLIAAEPDLGTALVMLLVGYGILFIVGIEKKIILWILGVAVVVSPLLYTYGIKDYQKKRITDFLSEKPSYHVQQSIIAIGSGGLMGKIEDEATQAQLKFLPIATSDFIFAYVVERYGFLGAFGLIAMYLLLISYLLLLNFTFKNDFLVTVFASGVGLLIFFNMSVNILMVIGFAPVVGLPLPMFSYGGSSFINYIVIIAILENLLAFRFKVGYRYEKNF